MRRKYPEWTLEPKSIQSQRAQLASLMKVFQCAPWGMRSGSMPALADWMKDSGSYIGKFPYPGIYPPSIQQFLPLETTQWVRFNPLCQYSGWGHVNSGSYYVGYIVVDVTTDPKKPAIKGSSYLLCNEEAGNANNFEFVIPVEGGMKFVVASSSLAGDHCGGTSFYCSSKEQLYLAMAFCQDPCPLSQSTATLSYFVDPDVMLRPNLG